MLIRLSGKVTSIITRLIIRDNETYSVIFIITNRGYLINGFNFWNKKNNQAM